MNDWSWPVGCRISSRTIWRVGIGFLPPRTFGVNLKLNPVTANLYTTDSRRVMFNAQSENLSFRISTEKPTMLASPLSTKRDLSQPRLKRPGPLPSGPFVRRQRKIGTTSHRENPSKTQNLSELFIDGHHASRKCQGHGALCGWLSRRRPCLKGDERAQTLQAAPTVQILGGVSKLVNFFREHLKPRASHNLFQVMTSGLPRVWKQAVTGEIGPSFGFVSWADPSDRPISC